MPVFVENFRKSSVKKVKNPDDASQFVPLLVIDEIEFVDAKSYAQGYRFAFDNGDDYNPTVGTSRVVHTYHLTGSDGSSKLDQEVIDFLTNRDPKSYAQEFEYAFKVNDDGSSDSSLRKFHDVKVLGGESNDDASIFLVSRVTDTWKVVDPKSYAQAAEFRLRHPDGWPDPSKVASTS